MSSTAVTPTQSAPKSEVARIPTLDGIRAISILFVLFGHAAFNPASPAIFIGLQDYANFGVRIFFVLSGFLITTLLLNEGNRHGSLSLKKFYLRRVFRIFPASYAYIVFIGILSIFGYLQLRHNDWFAAALYWMNFHQNRGWWLGHLWSLAVEEQFYLIWPAVLAWSGWKFGRWAALFVVVAMPIFRISLYYQLLQFLWLIGDGAFFVVADALAWGCLLAGFRDRLELSSWYRRLATMPMAAVVFGSAQYAAKLAGAHPRWAALFLWTWMDIAIAFSIHACVLNADSVVGRFLEFRPLAFLGVLSYSLYLWQQLFMNYHQDALFPNPLIGMLLALVAAASSYYVIEKPFLRMKQRLFP